MRPFYWHENNTKCSEWFERDRAMVRLTNTRNEEIFCLVDDEVNEFIDDGFKKYNESWHSALSRYATENKLTVKG